MIQKALIILVVIFIALSGVSLFTVKDTVSGASDNTNLLELKEGMKYGYFWQTPPAGSEFDIYIDIYITKEDESFLEGITATTNKDGTRLHRFKITKDDFELYTTTWLNEKKIFDDEIDYKKITTASSENFIIIPLFFALNKQVYGFDMDGLIENKSVTTLWGGGDSTNLTLEGPLNYNNYNCYKIIAEISNELYNSISTTYYVSTLPPYLLIDQYSSIANMKNYVIISLEKVEKKSFNLEEYNVNNPPNQWPIPEFSYSIDNLTVEFNASGSYDPDGEIIHYLWDFGDGTNGTGINPTHKYAASGDYIVKLTVIDDEGESKSRTKIVTITTSSTNKEDNENDSNSSSNDGKDTSTPGFELVFIVIAVAFVLFWKRYKL